MAVSWTISRYLVAEVARCTALGLLAAAPVILIPNVFDRAEEFAVGGLAPADQLEIARCAVPLVLGYALPIAFLFGTMLAIGRLGGDREVTAMRASGLGPAALVAPACLLGAIVSLMTAYFTIELEPRCKRDLAQLSLRLAARGGLIEVGRFQSFGDRVVFAQRRGADRRLEAVMISDASSGDRRIQIFAETADFSLDPETGRVRMSLQNGDLRMQPAPIEAFDEYRISFEQLDYEFPALRVGAGPQRYWVDQLQLNELRQAISRLEAGESVEDLTFRNPLMYATQIQRMFAIPFAPLLFALVGVSLGLRGAVPSGARGMLLALVLFGSYYGLFVYAQDVSREGLVPPQLAIWAPNAILLVGGIAGVVDARRLRRRARQ
ncbi:MAG: LptF/LptG family permease [Deltaproteobacteria bacterium]|nr:LptF/LptG family permease [Deltaproteobacteria bacterium]